MWSLVVVGLTLAAFGIGRIFRDDAGGAQTPTPGPAIAIVASPRAAPVRINAGGVASPTAVPTRVASADDGINVVCKTEGFLLSLVVDEIGDVLEVEDHQFEETPHTITGAVGNFMSGVYKLPDNLLTVIDAKKIIEYLNS